jgi:hypothetical protein
MPKKGGTKVDPEKAKEMFTAWKTSKEGIARTLTQIAKLWDELLEIIKENRDAETLEDDFTEHYRFFFFKLQNLYEEMKVPKRPKSMGECEDVEAFDQEVVRVYYFQNKKQEYVCNGKNGAFEEREMGQDSLRMRNLFVEVVVLLKKKGEITETDFLSTAVS